jgi:hypothetical protein
VIRLKYLDLAIANETIKTTDIKGKEYAEVNQRIKAFRMVYPEGTIETEMLSNENGVCIFKAIVKNNDKILGTGTAYENEGSTFINKTSYIENCETSAVGRALGMCGFGIDVSVASAEEVQNAIANQQEPTQEEADNYVIQFGKKHYGETLKQVEEKDSKYIDWLINNTNDDRFLKIIELATGRNIPSASEMDERIKLVAELTNVELEYDIPHEKTLEVYKVNSTNEMTVFQLTDAIAKIKASKEG